MQPGQAVGCVAETSYRKETSARRLAGMWKRMREVRQLPVDQGRLLTELERSRELASLTTLTTLCLVSYFPIAFPYSQG